MAQHAGARLQRRRTPVGARVCRERAMDPGRLPHACPIVVVRRRDDADEIAAAAPERLRRRRLVAAAAATDVCRPSAARGRPAGRRKRRESYAALAGPPSAPDSCAENRCPFRARRVRPRLPHVVAVLDRDANPDHGRRRRSRPHGGRTAAVLGGDGARFTDALVGRGRYGLLRVVDSDLGNLRRHRTASWRTPDEEQSPGRESWLCGAEAAGPFDCPGKRSRRDGADRCWNRRGGDGAMTDVDARALSVLLRPSAAMLSAMLALVAWAGYLTVTAPDDLRGPYVVLLLCQSFAASTGYAPRARRGHFDQLLAGRPSRLRFAVTHALTSAALGGLSWAAISVIDALGGGGHWPLGFTPKGAAAFIYNSALAWAASVPFSRYSAGVAWLIVAIGLAGSGRLI